MLQNINPINPDSQIIAQAVEILRRGGVIVYPTDTIYGLGCDIFNKDAVKKIYRLKKREAKKPLSIICADIKEISQYALISNYAFGLLKKYLPGPYTFILKAKNKIPDTFLAKNKTVGIRIPDNKICRELAKQMGNPIITTSLNISGQEIMTSPSQLSKEMINNIDLILDAGLLPQEPSTIIDLSDDQAILIRPGKGTFPL